MANIPKILMLINQTAGGGAENVFMMQYRYFISIGMQVFLGTTACSDMKEKEEFYNVGFKSVFDIGGYRRLINFIKSRDIRIVYSTLDLSIFVSRVVALFCPQLVVVIRESGMAYRKSLFLKISDVIFNARVSATVAVSREVADSLLYYQPFYKQKIEVISNGATPSMSVEEIIKLRKAKKVSNDTFTIINVGSMNGDNKGQDGLIRLAAYIKNHLPNLRYRLLLVGNGSRRSEFEKLVSVLGLEAQISFQGFASGGKLKELYLYSDVFILNSANEGCPNVILEAMSYALPVIATPVGSISALIIPEETGWVVKRNDFAMMTDKVKLLIGDPGNMYRTGEAGYRHLVSNFNFSRQTNKIIELFTT